MTIFLYMNIGMEVSLGTWK